MRYQIKTAVVVFIFIILSSNVFAETELIIVTGEIPPMISEQLENSFLTEIFQAVGREMNVSFVFRFIPWKRCEIEIKQLRAWGAIPYVRTPEREEIYDFSERLYESGSVLFGYKTGNISYTELRELKNYKIGGVSGYWYEKMFHDAGIELEFVTNEEQNLRKLWGGRIDFAPMNETAGWHMIRNMNLEEIENFFTLEKPLHVSDSFLMTSKLYPDGQELLSRFNTALRKIKENGVFQEIADKRGIYVTY